MSLQQLTILLTSQENTRILWNPKVHYLIQNFPPPVPILSQLGPVHKPTSNNLKFHFNFILTSTPGSTKWSLSLRFPQPILCIGLSYHLASYMLRLSHSSDFITKKMLSKEYRTLSSSLCSFPLSFVTSSSLDLNILLKPLSSDTLSQSSSRNVTNQFSHSHKTTGKIIVLYISLFNLLDSSQEDKTFCPE